MVDEKQVWEEVPAVLAIICGVWLSGSDGGDAVGLANEPGGFGTTGGELAPNLNEGGKAF